MSHTILGVDAIVIGVHDLDAARGDYQALLGREGAEASGRVRFPLRNTALELEPCEAEEGIQRLVFASVDLSPEDAEVRIPSAQARGLDIRIVASRAPAGELGFEPGTVYAIDHVVLMSAAPDATKKLFGEELGLRLALDREFPKFGSRLLFFRTGGLTVEVGGKVDAEPDPARPDRLWGLALLTPELDAARARLRTAGFDVSDIRDGRKKGTRVCTVRDRTCGVPTLLIAQASAE